MELNKVIRKVLGGTKMSGVFDIGLNITEDELRIIDAHNSLKISGPEKTEDIPHWFGDWSSYWEESPCLSLLSSR